MRRLRFTIAGLLGFVMFVAVGFAALREASPVWDSALFSLTLGMLGISVLLALHRRGRRRAFWVGFAVVGGAYFGASLVPAVESRLVTTAFMNLVESKVQRPVPSGSTVWVDLGFPSSSWMMPGGSTVPIVNSVAFSPNGQTLAVASPPGVVRLWDASTGAWLGWAGGSSLVAVRIGHALWALVFGVLGGWLSRGLHARGDGLWPREC